MATHFLINTDDVEHRYLAGTILDIDESFNISFKTVDDTVLHVQENNIVKIPNINKSDKECSKCKNVQPFYRYRSLICGHKICVSCINEIIKDTQIKPEDFINKCKCPVCHCTVNIMGCRHHWYEMDTYTFLDYTIHSMCYLYYTHVNDYTKNVSPIQLEVWKQNLLNKNKLIKCLNLTISDIEICRVEFMKNPNVNNLLYKALTLSVEVLILTLTETDKYDSDVMRKIHGIYLRNIPLFYTSCVF